MPPVHAIAPQGPALSVAFKASVTALVVCGLAPILAADSQPLLTQLLVLGLALGLWVEAVLSWAQWQCLRRADEPRLMGRYPRLVRASVWLHRLMMPWCLLTAFALVPKAGVVPGLSVWLFGR